MKYNLFSEKLRGRILALKELAKIGKEAGFIEPFLRIWKPNWYGSANALIAFIGASPLDRESIYPDCFQTPTFLKPSQQFNQGKRGEFWKNLRHHTKYIFEYKYMEKVDCLKLVVSGNLLDKYTSNQREIVSKLTKDNEEVKSSINLLTSIRPKAIFALNNKVLETIYQSFMALGFRELKRKVCRVTTCYNSTGQVKVVRIYLHSPDKSWAFVLSKTVSHPANTPNDDQNYKDEFLERTFDSSFDILSKLGENAEEDDFEDAMLEYERYYEELRKQAELSFNEGDFENSKKYDLQRLEISPDCPFIMSTIALSSIHLHHLKDAHHYLTKAIKINPDLTFIWADLMMVAEKLFDNEAFERYKSNYLSTKINSSDGEKYERKGNLIDLNLNDLESINKHILESPLNYGLYNIRGLIWVNLGQSVHAINDFNKALALNPNDAIVIYNLGLVHHEMTNNPELALHYFSKAYKLGHKMAYFKMYEIERGFDKLGTKEDVINAIVNKSPGNDLPF